MAALEKRTVEVLKQLDQVEAQKIDIESENHRLRAATKSHESVLLKQLDGYESGGFVRAAVTGAVLNDVDPRNIFYVYEVTVEMGSFRYVLPRRYKQFAKVHDELTAGWKSGMEPLPEFPPTTYFKNVSPQFADQRKAALSNWLEALTSGDRPDQEPLVDFLELSSVYQIFDSMTKQAAHLSSELDRQVPALAKDTSPSVDPLDRDFEAAQQKMPTFGKKD